MKLLFLILSVDESAEPMNELPLFFLVAAVAFAVVCLYRKFFERIKAMPVVGPLLAENFPPNGYYRACVNEKLQAKANALPFACRYPGRYEIDLVGFKGKPFAKIDVGLYVRVTDKDGRVLYTDTKANSSVLMSQGRKGGRYLRLCYFDFELPEKFPVNKQLLFSYELYGQYCPFLKANPQTQIVLQKFEDE